MIRIKIVCFKQKSSYEMRISYWSSYVCSSDLKHPVWTAPPQGRRGPTIFSGDRTAVLKPPAWRNAGKNRDPHRRWRGRFAILDPTHSTPGGDVIFSIIRR